MKRIPTSLLALAAIAALLAACMGSQIPNIRQTLVYGERFTWNIYPVPSNAREVIVSNVALSGSEDTRLNYVTRLSGSGQLLWETPPMVAPENKPIVALSADAVAIAFDTHLTALAMADGKALWEAKLSGRVGFCESCVAIVDDRVVVYSDKAIEGFDLATGKRIWSQRVPRVVQAMQPAGPWLAIALPQTINLYQPGDGKIALQIPLQCEGAQQAGMPRDMSPIMTGSAGNDDFYLRLGTCVQRWDLKEGKRAWDVAFDKDSLGRLGNFKGILRRKHSEVLQAGPYVFMSTGESLQQKAPRGLTVIDASSGDARNLLTSDEHYLIPVAMAAEDHVLVRVKHFRGSTLDQLWSVDVKTGEQTWVFKPEELAEWDVLSAMHEHGIALVQFGAREQTQQVKPLFARAVRSDVVVQFLNPQTGATTGPQPAQMQLADANWIEAVTDSTTATAFLNFGTVYAVDLKTLSNLYQWP